MCKVGQVVLKTALLRMVSVLEPRRLRQTKKSVLADDITPRRGCARELAERQTLNTTAKRTEAP